MINVVRRLRLSLGSRLGLQGSNSLRLGIFQPMDNINNDSQNKITSFVISNCNFNINYLIFY
jgi:hypothetical protein